MRMGYPNGDMTPEQRDAYDAAANAVHMERDRVRNLQSELDLCNKQMMCEAEQVREERIFMAREREKLLLELCEAERRTELAEARRADSDVRQSVLRRELSRVLSCLVHGETRKAHDLLRQVVVRSEERTPPEPLGTLTDSIIPVCGRGLVSGVVSFSFSGLALVIRVDDIDRPDFWLEISISETRLLRLLAALHRQCHGDNRPTSS